MDVMTSESPAAATIGSRAATQAELHIVEKCRSVRSDAVWVQWLGYPKSRNCWRSASSHFPQLKGDDASLVLAAHRRVKTTIAAMAEAELEGSGLVLIQGRQPIAREIRVKPAVPTIPSGPALKKQKRQHSESKVHTIRVGEASIQESVRVAGGKVHMFRLSVFEVKDDSVTCHWIFPESSPGDASAWVGLWDASSACPLSPRGRPPMHVAPTPP